MGTPEKANVFHPMQLLDIEPYLYCTEEMAVFAFSYSGRVCQSKRVQGVAILVVDSQEQLEIYERKQALDDGTSIKLQLLVLSSERLQRLLTEIANNMPVESLKCRSITLKR